MLKTWQTAKNAWHVPYYIGDEDYWKKRLLPTSSCLFHKKLFTNQGMEQQLRFFSFQQTRPAKCHTLSVKLTHVKSDSQNLHAQLPNWTYLMPSISVEWTINWTARTIIDFDDIN